MALEHAILVSLAERSASGYDLARRFDASIGHFWRATHQQIYKVLARMEEQSWVTSVTAPGGGRREKKVYSITEAGRVELERWTQEPSTKEITRSDFAVKLRGFASPAAIRRDTEQRREAHLITLAAYEENQKRYYPNPERLSGQELGAYLALRGGIQLEKSGISWCDEILSAMKNTGN